MSNLLLKEKRFNTTPMKRPTQPNKAIQIKNEQDQRLRSALNSCTMSHNNCRWNHTTRHRDLRRKNKRNNLERKKSPSGASENRQSPERLQESWEAAGEVTENWKKKYFKVSYQPIIITPSPISSSVFFCHFFVSVFSIFSFMLLFIKINKIYIWLLVKSSSFKTLFSGIK